MIIEEKKIVFYDGECGFCNRSVAFVLKHDKTKSIHFASIQSGYSIGLFEQNNWITPDLSTFYFYDNGELFEKSSAAIKVAKYFSYPQTSIRSLVVIPRFIRDDVYDLIAKKRHRISKGYCVVPTEQEKNRFTK